MHEITGAVYGKPWSRLTFMYRGTPGLIGRVKATRQSVEVGVCL
jgi:hypothetical protein